MMLDWVGTRAYDTHLFIWGDLRMWADTRTSSDR